MTSIAEVFNKQFDRFCVKRFTNNDFSLPSGVRINIQIAVARVKIRINNGLLTFPI